MHKGNYVLFSLYYKQKRQTVRTTWLCSQAAKQPAPDQALINLGHLSMGKKQPEKICMVEGYKTDKSMLPFPNIF